MAGRTVLYFISIILLLSIISPPCFCDEFEELYRTKENICSFIEKGKFTEAKTAADKMAIEYTGHEKLPEMLYWVAERYQRFDRFDDSKQIYEQIIRDYPESPWAVKSKIAAARIEATSLIASGKYDEAKAATEKMADDFEGNADLPETLYWIAERYQRADKFDEAKQVYQRIIHNYSENQWAKKAGMMISRAEIESLIVSGKYEDADKAIKQFIMDFANRPELPGAIYWIAERYERTGRADDAKRNYQQIIERFPNNIYARKAKLGVPRAEVRGFIEAGDFNRAAVELNRLTAEFAGHPDMAESLYWLAERLKYFGRNEDANLLQQQIMQNEPESIYAKKAATEGKEFSATEGKESTEQKSTSEPEVEKAAVELYRVARGYEEANDFNSAVKAYQQVVKDYPATIKGGNAVLDIRRLEILQAIESNDNNQAQVLLTQFVEDFNQHPYAGDCLDIFVDKCYWSATELRKQNKFQQAMRRFAFTENILKIIIDKKAAGNSNIGNSDTFEALYFYSANCRYQQGKWEKAIAYLQKIVDEYPTYEHACNAQVAIGWCYEALVNTERWPKDTVNPLIEEAYKAVLDKYPDCYMVASAAYRLGELSFEKGDKASALKYYKKFLELTEQGNKMIEEAQAKIAGLEDTK